MRYNENRLRRIIRDAIDEFAPERLCVSIKNNVDKIISEYKLKEPKKPERGW